MSPAFRLGGLELQRFARARLTRAALVAVVLIPLLYSGLYLWSFWNPQGNIGNIPVALVVLDDGDLGRELADNLIDRQIFAWKETDPADAEKGVQEGTYYGSLTIPADFTANLKSPSKDGPPQPAYLQVHVDQGKSYLFETIAKAVFAEVQATVGKSAISDYLDRIFVSFGKLHDSTLKAARGADQLADGAGDARSGAGRLQDGLGTARQGTAKLSDGLRTAGTGASTLAQGLGSAKKGADDLLSGAYKLHRGAGTLTQGLVTAKDGTSKLAAGAVKLDQGAAKLAAGNAEAFQQVDQFRPIINQLADQAVPFLRSHTGDIRQLAEFVNVAASFLADCLADLPARIQADRVKADKAYKALKTYLDTHPDLDPQLRTLLEAAEKAAKRLAELADWLDALVGEHLADLKQLERDALGVARLARQLANLAPRLAGLIDQARDKFNELDNGLAKLADGAAKLHQGTGEAVKGATKLDAGMTKLVDGASKLNTGLGTLVAGANKLDIGLGKLTGGANKLNAGLGQLGQGAGSLDSGLAQLYGGAGDLGAGLGKLDSGATELANSLADGAKQIPDYNGDERDERAAMMSDPVRILNRIDDPVPNYGTGFAPYFLPLSLWVGAMITYMILRPLNPRVLASATPSWRAALAGWLPATGLGLLQVGVVAAMVRWGLGMQVQNWPGLIGLLALTSATFMAMLQALQTLLGAVGRVVALAVLMLQLTSASGTYPIETSAAFFQDISNWLPMTWVVAALRRLISGGYVVPVYQAAGVLVIFLVGALALTTLAARRGRMWSITRLHPVLSI